MNRCIWSNEVLHSERSWIYLHGLFEPLFSLAELLNIVVVRNFEVMLGQTLDHLQSVEFCLCGEIPLFILLLLNYTQLVSVGMITA
jgi:hypothetical protein